MHADRQTLRQSLAGVRLFLLDLDGTTYVENRLIPRALEFLNRIRETGRCYVFLTNNASRSSRDYVRKLNGLGIPAALENVFTSGQAAALYLTRGGARPRVFLVGTASLQEELTGYGVSVAGRNDDSAEFVLVSFDTELEYWKLEKACRLIDNGVPFLATHPDLVCPVEGRRYIPDCGSICQMISNATGKTPAMVFGKPDAKMVEMLCQVHGVARSQVAMIGDRLYTDIALGNNAGILSICVLSGESTPDSIARSPHKPGMVIDSVADLIELLSPLPLS